MQIKEKLESFLRMPWPSLTICCIKLAELYSWGIEWWEKNTEIFFDSLSWRKYFTQIAISLRGSKLTDETGPKDLTWLVDTWDFTSLFYFDR